jgi:hypothetical protein
MNIRQIVCKLLDCAATRLIRGECLVLSPTQSDRLDRIAAHDASLREWLIIDLANPSQPVFPEAYKQHEWGESADIVTTAWLAAHEYTVATGKASGRIGTPVLMLTKNAEGQLVLSSTWNAPLIGLNARVECRLALVGEEKSARQTIQIVADKRSALKLDELWERLVLAYWDYYAPNDLDDRFKAFRDGVEAFTGSHKLPNECPTIEQRPPLIVIAAKGFETQHNNGEPLDDDARALADKYWELVLWFISMRPDYTQLIWGIYQSANVAVPKSYEADLAIIKIGQMVLWIPSRRLTKHSYRAFLRLGTAPQYWQKPQVGELPPWKDYWPSYKPQQLWDEMLSKFRPWPALE